MPKIIYNKVVIVIQTVCIGARRDRPMELNSTELEPHRNGPLTLKISTVEQGLKKLFSRNCAWLNKQTQKYKTHFTK